MVADQWARWKLAKVPGSPREFRLQPNFSGCQARLVAKLGAPSSKYRPNIASQQEAKKGLKMNVFHRTYIQLRLCKRHGGCTIGLGAARRAGEDKMCGIGVPAEWHGEKGGGCGHAQCTRAGGAERAARNNEQTATLWAQYNTTRRDTTLAHLEENGRAHDKEGERQRAVNAQRAALSRRHTTINK
jgi:hypothetical protein